MKYAMVILLVAIGGILGGCQSMTRDSDQQIRKYSRVADVNRRLLTEDMDVILLLDKPSTLTNWHIRTD